jgi:hypothetical protein
VTRAALIESRLDVLDEVAAILVEVTSIERRDGPSQAIDDVRQRLVRVCRLVRAQIETLRTVH